MRGPPLSAPAPPTLAHPQPSAARRRPVRAACFLHFKMKMHQPLVYSCCSGVIDLYYHPLVKIHLLGAKAEGALKRPFGAADPNAANPFAALMKPPPGAQAAPQASPDSLKNDTD